jgi:hypothetical protein
MNYKLWNRVEMINGVAPSHFLNQHPFKDYKGDIILIYADNGKVSNVECKDILASVYEIDKTLPLDEFMSAYFAKLEEMNKPVEE